VHSRVTTRLLKVNCGCTAKYLLWGII